MPCEAFEGIFDYAERKLSMPGLKMQQSNYCCYIN